MSNTIKPKPVKAICGISKVFNAKLSDGVVV